jgi:hypothetical protein
VTVVTDGWDDEELLSALRQALAARRAVPPEFVEAGKNAFAWHNIDAELAQLTYDSTHAPQLEAATRAESASIRALTFTSARITLELEVTENSLLGQVVPAQAATIDVEAHDSPDTQIASDEIGCFAIQPIPSGPFRLHCRAAGGVNVITGWITL